MEMPDCPDEIYVHFQKDDGYVGDCIDGQLELSEGYENKYHHDHIVQSLRRENEELRTEYTSMGVTLAARNSEIDELQAKLDKAKYGLKDIARQYKSTEWEEEGDTEYGYDMIIERARTTLEEIE